MKRRDLLKALIAIPASALIVKNIDPSIPAPDNVVLDNSVVTFPNFLSSRPSRIGNLFNHGENQVTIGKVIDMQETENGLNFTYQPFSSHLNKLRKKYGRFRE